MENYIERQKERESEFKRELIDLLRKYDAVIEVSTDYDYYGNDIEVDVELKGNDKSGVVEPYTYFNLPKYLHKDTEL